MQKNRLFIILIFIFFVSSVFAQTRTHLVKPGDTLYSLAKRYEVTIDAILNLNPTIEGTNIPAGYTLVIPDKDEPKSEKKSFIASLFRKKDKKANQQEEIETTEQEDSLKYVDNEEEEQETEHVRTKLFGAPDNIAVILPFNLNSQTSTDDRQQMRSVEFYEGFLLAVREAEKKGQKILVQTYDLGTKTMGEILATKSLLDADMIIAPMELPDVAPIAEFGKQHNINVVSPFVFSQELSKDNKNLIQINTSKSLLYDVLTVDLLTRFNNYDFVFLTDTTNMSKADPYADYLRAGLKARDVNYYEYKYRNPEPLARVDTLLGIANHDILYIPVVNSKEAMQKMFPCLKCTTFDPEAGALEKGRMAILGYPEWILYVSDFMEYYYDMNVYMFSKFYINPFDEDVRSFYADFRYWFAKEPMSLTPRYALLGFDVGRYFLAAIHRYGMNFNEHLEGFEQEMLQSAMSYKNIDGGIVNKGLYLVNFTPQTKIEKYEIK